ncbi:MAG TPA: FhaA domain-containing protein, partial [Candidatus Baltobacteraceae bacterium]|nr:FhaA domain-containing protein [Candidatus Baltobacteraceae bacterium]
MNALMRVEALCANVVERAFAVAFPSALEPVQIARKLVAAFESAPPSGRGGRRFIVRLSLADFSRLADEREYLEGRWATMLTRLGERSRLPHGPPEVTMASDPQV